LLCALLTVFSAITLYGTHHIIRRANDAALAESTVAWLMPTGVHLRTGPASFHYDPDRKLLSHRGPLNNAEQLQLRDLLEFDAERELQPALAAPAAGSGGARMDSKVSRPLVQGAASSSAWTSRSATTMGAQADSSTGAVTRANASDASVETSASDVKSVSRSYHAAISLLAYKSQASQAKQVQLLLLLGMLGGALGAFLRSFVDFVGNACYKNELDLVIWWPLYATRPVVGAILGFLLVVLFKARFLTSTDIQSGSDTFWWLGMAALGGFSTMDVTARLRQAAKALFGGSEDKRG
jgi:hypothetical protein